jgi:hypothetical protein
MNTNNNRLCRINGSYTDLNIPESAVGYIEYSDKERYIAVFMLPQGSVRLMIKKDQLDVICLKEISV